MIRRPIRRCLKGRSPSSIVDDEICLVRFFIDIADALLTRTFGHSVPSISPSYFTSVASSARTIGKQQLFLATFRGCFAVDIHGGHRMETIQGWSALGDLAETGEYPLFRAVRQRATVPEREVANDVKRREHRFFDDVSFKLGETPRTMSFLLVLCWDFYYYYY